MSTNARIRVAIVQMNPLIGQVQNNIDRATALCSKLKPRTLDLVLLPEMAFTGYVFPNAAAIEPYLEAPRLGPTSQFCATLARRLECIVIVGYPERLEPNECQTDTSVEGDGVRKIGANSAIVYDASGEFVSGYRKTNLFSTDMTWAIPGTGFATLQFPPPLNTVSLGICMDLNPQPPTEWTSSGEPYEIAEHVLLTDSSTLILLNAWLDSKSDPEDEEDWGTLNYWAARLRPLWEESTKRADGKKTTVLVCNRSGEENDATFAGTSSVFSFTTGSKRPKLAEMAPRNTEAVYIWEV